MIEIMPKLTPQQLVNEIRGNNPMIIAFKIMISNADTNTHIFLHAIYRALIRNTHVLWADIIIANNQDFKIKSTSVSYNEFARMALNQIEMDVYNIKEIISEHLNSSSQEDQENVLYAKLICINPRTQREVKHLPLLEQMNISQLVNIMGRTKCTNRI